MTGPRWLPAAAVTVFAAALAWLNRGERVAIDVGMVTFYRVPLAIVLLSVFLAGMLSMVLLSLRHDRLVRDELRRHGLLHPEEPGARAASAWGVAREPAPSRQDGQTAAYPHQGAGPVSFAHEDERTVAYRGEDERPVSYAREDERTIAYPGEAERPVSHVREDERRIASHGQEERTIAYPDQNQRTVSTPREDERTISYPRLDEDPAA